MTRAASLDEAAGWVPAEEERGEEMGDVSTTEERFWQQLRQPCPVPKGARIRLLVMPNDPCPVEPGTEGTVTGGTGAQIWVNWDNGRTLALIPGEDSYEVISGGEPDGG